MGEFSPIVGQAADIIHADIIKAGQGNDPVQTDLALTAFIIAVGPGAYLQYSGYFQRRTAAFAMEQAQTGRYPGQGPVGLTPRGVSARFPGESMQCVCFHPFVTILSKISHTIFAVSCAIIQFVYPHGPRSGNISRRDRRKAAEPYRGMNKKAEYIYADTY